MVVAGVVSPDEVTTHAPKVLSEHPVTSRNFTFRQVSMPRLGGNHLSIHDVTVNYRQGK